MECIILNTPGAADRPDHCGRSGGATINTGLKQLAGTILDNGAAYEGMSFRSEDQGGSLNAIREKRKPKFQGR